MEVKPKLESFAKIKVLGLGGAGNNAISRMVKDKLKGIDFVAINTDAQDLHHCEAQKKVHIGKTLTKGLGAGMNPEIGRSAAEEDQDEIKKAVEGCDMVFLTLGLGGGTGTGSAPVVADIAKEAGALTVAVVTKPFTFEGAQRREIAESGAEELEGRVDTMITIPNDRILQIIDKKTSLTDAFGVVDDVLRQGVQGISELITVPGLVNLDFADIRAVMENAGSALMGIGQAAGENRATEAARQAIESPLLELAIDGAKGIIFNVTGGQDMSMFEIDEAAKVITESADPSAKVIFGAVVDDEMQGEIRVTVVATGFNQKSKPKKVMASGSTDDLMPWAALHAKRNDDREEEPLVKRESKEEAREKAKAIKKSSAIEEDELDIPAFIRKKMK